MKQGLKRLIGFLYGFISSDNVGLPINKYTYKLISDIFSFILSYWLTKRLHFCHEYIAPIFFQSLEEPLLTQELEPPFSGKTRVSYDHDKI